MVFFSSRAQGAIEYLLIIAVAIVVVAIVLIALTGLMGTGQTGVDVSSGAVSTGMDNMQQTLADQSNQWYLPPEKTKNFIYTGEPTTIGTLKLESTNATICVELDCSDEIEIATGSTIIVTTAAKPGTITKTNLTPE